MDGTPGRGGTPARQREPRHGRDAPLSPDVRTTDAVPAPPITVRVDGIAHGGEAVGRLPDGRAVFIAGTIPGETVRVVVTENRDRWARADLLEVIAASPDRRVPPCPYATDCGGCQWQHITDVRQRALKEQVVREQLAHIGGIPDAPVRTIAQTSPPLGYREQVRVAVLDDGRSGYRRAGSHDILAVATCAVLRPDVDAARRGLHGPGEARLRRTDDGVRGGDEPGVITAGAHTYHVSGDAFFQVSSAAAAHLVEVVEAALPDGRIGRVVDAYAGVGLFTVPLATRADEVLAVETDAAALADLYVNTASLSNVDVRAGAVEDALEVAAADVVVADPPRAGLSKMAAAAITGTGAGTIVLVACDPAALARDSRRLVSAGYTLDWVQPLDLFPQTFHIEAIARFQLS